MGERVGEVRDIQDWHTDLASSYQCLWEDGKPSLSHAEADSSGGHEVGYGNGRTGCVAKKFEEKRLSVNVPSNVLGDQFDLTSHITFFHALPLPFLLLFTTSKSL